LEDLFNPDKLGLAQTLFIFQQCSTLRLVFYAPTQRIGIRIIKLLMAKYSLSNYLLLIEGVPLQKAYSF